MDQLFDRVFFKTVGMAALLAVAVYLLIEAALTRRLRRLRSRRAQAPSPAPGPNPR